MTTRETVPLLASLFRAANAARPVLLLGAGASFSSGVPMAGESVRRLARRVYAEKVHGAAVRPERVKLTEWLPWLHSQPWFISGDENVAENFPLVVKYLLEPREYRAQLIRELLHPSNDLGSGYQRLAEFALRGLVRTILTTNFDVCIPTALNRLRPHLKHFAEVNRGPDDLSEFNLFNTAPQIVWMHGKAEQYTDRAGPDEIDKIDAKLAKKLYPLLGASPLIVIGYRGSEASIVDYFLARGARETKKFSHGIYWCSLPGEVLHPRVAALRSSLGGNFRALEIAGFDEVMSALAHELRHEDCYPHSIATRAVEQPSFDDTPADGATLDDLDQSLMLSALRDYCDKLGRKPVTTETLVPLLREQGLLVSHNGTEVPTTACVLLFGNRVQRRFPHAVISATTLGKRRIVFEGNLMEQRRALIEWLESDDVNPPILLKGPVTHRRTTPYATRALVELLVNVLAHRDYSMPEPATIDLEPGVQITFSNPGGLPDAVAKQVTVGVDGTFRPVPRLSELRNRSLGDILFGVNVMERAGTGLSDVEALTREVGGTAVFAQSARGTRFVARLVQAASSAGSKSVARDERRIETYVLNALMFSSVPERLTVVRLIHSGAWRFKGLNLSNAGTFVEYAGELWSFVPLDVLSSIVAPVLDLRSGAVQLTADVERDTTARRVLSWLIRKHFERHICGFAADGLLIEPGHHQRAYFQGQASGPRTLTYDTPRRRAVKRQVVKQRRDGPSPWFENEGFGYQVAQIDAGWAIRIKPFYMFTGPNARSPLPAFTRAARATRRMKFDRNRNVDDDLTFWGRFLTRGAPTISIGQHHVTDLVLGGSFRTVDVDVGAAE